METFAIGGDLEVRRLGFGAMRLTGGEAIWGPAADPDAARAVLRRAVELGAELIDTADSYGPQENERLVADALAPYAGVTVATKVGVARPSPEEWVPLGRPEYLRQQVELSLRNLRVDTIDLLQLHRVDPTVPFEEQIGALRDLRDAGKIRHVGLSEVTVDDVEAARRLVPIATVQNLYNLSDRTNEPVLRHCEEHGIGFIPYFPLAAGELAGNGGPLAVIAERHGASTSAVAIAWLLQRSLVMLPIPGTTSVAHLEANMAARDLQLATDEVGLLDSARTEVVQSITCEA